MHLHHSSNPWYLTTATMAQYLYSVASEYQNAGSLTVNNVTAPFFAYYAPNAGLKSKTYKSNTKEFASVIASLKGWGDAYIRRIKYHTPAGGNLAEEFNRNDGHAQGVMLRCLPLPLLVPNCRVTRLTFRRSQLWHMNSLLVSQRLHGHRSIALAVLLILDSVLGRLNFSRLIASSLDKDPQEFT
jgi:hypothetical protein